MQQVALHRFVPAVLVGVALFLAAHRAAAQISVGPSGVAVLTFGSAPPGTEWSTYSVVGAAGDITTVAALDALVQTNFAGMITNSLATSNASLPNATALAVWSTSGYLQTRANASRFTLLLAKLQNNSGFSLSALNIAYDFTNVTSVTEEVLGHRVYFSTNGAAGTWQVTGITGAAGRKTATLPLGLWTNGASAYILWADENGSGSPDNANQIDNFSATVVLAFPAITAPPQSTNTSPGGGVTFSVSVSGVQPFSYQWLFNSNTIAGATNASLTLSNAQPGDEGFYSVIVSNAAGVVTSSNAFLAVICHAAGFLFQPSSQAVNAGVPVTLSCSVTGTAPLRVQWFKNGGALNGATNSSLTLNPSLVSDAGSYFVAVTNCAGVIVSTNAVITVNCLPVVISSQPANQGTNAGNPFSLSVSVTGSPLIQYQWFKNSSPLAGETNATYARAVADVADAGLYHAAIANCAGTFFTRTAVVSVAETPVTLVGLTNHFWKYEQSGTDLGTAWQATNYNDSAWPSGRGVFAWENLAFVIARTNTVLSLTNNGATTITFYFRTHFTLTNDPATITLMASNLLDDGAVFYLNGAEIHRINMPGTVITRATLASAASVEGAFMITNLPSDKLIQGDNVLAVELHQNSATSADVVFGMHVNVTFPLPGLLTITNQPADVSVEEGKAATFSVGISGAAARHQWFKDGVAIPGAVWPTLAIANVSLSDAGDYVVMASNAVAAVFSRLAHLGVTVDTAPPGIVSADALDATHLLVSFSEGLLAGTATNAANFRVVGTEGGVFNVLSAVLTNGTNVLLTTSARPPGVNYLVTVTNIADASPRQNVAVHITAPLATWLSVVPVDAVWQFYDPLPPFDDPSPGATWMLPEFTPPDWWGEGAAPFFAGLDAGVLPFGYNTALSLGSAVTSYFRAGFHLDATSVNVSLLLRHLVDDGAVFYVNGVELLRTNLAAGTVTPQTLTTNRIDTLSLTASLPVPGDAIRPGWNVLAAELHQWSVNDTDKVFAVQMDARVASFATGPVLLVGGPRDVAVREGQSATFSVTQAGGLTFQWQRNGSDFALTHGDLVLPSVTPAMDGDQLRVFVSNSTGGVMSATATLHVISDLTPPALVSAYVWTNNTITISFTEPLTAETATNLANYLVTNSLGQASSVAGASLENGTNVVLTFSALPAAAYKVVVNNVRDTSLSAHRIAPDSTATAGFSGIVVPISAWWRYDQSGAGNDTDWRDKNYSDTAPPWALGRALFEGKSGIVPALPEPVRTLLSLSNSGAAITCHYFRTHFNSFAAGAGTLSFRTILDDGGVIYFNGIEVFRMRMPGTDVLYSTLANAAVGDAVYEGPFTVVVTNIFMGDNTIAVEVHASSLTSSDVTWAGEFSVNVPSSSLTAPLVPPPLRLKRWGAGFALESSGDAAVIETAPAITGPWTTITNAPNPLFLPTGGAAAFFRARR